MKEYQPLLDEYSKDGYEMYSQRMSRAEWGNVEVATRYLEKYWMASKEYGEYWKPIQKSVFTNECEPLPALIFNESYQVLAFRGGSLFVEKSFIALRDCMRLAGDSTFAVVQNEYCGLLDELPPFRMRFPVTITWDELMGGGFISSIMIEMFYNDYFVFGDKGSWGKYAANDYKMPVDLIGFQPELNEVFRRNFPISDEELRKELGRLSPNYDRYMP